MRPRHQRLDRFRLSEGRRPISIAKPYRMRRAEAWSGKRPTPNAPAPQTILASGAIFPRVCISWQSRAACAEARRARSFSRPRRSSRRTASPSSSMRSSRRFRRSTPISTPATSSCFPPACAICAGALARRTRSCSRRRSTRTACLAHSRTLSTGSFGSIEFPRKPVAVLMASSRATFARDQLLEILETMSARVVLAACVTVDVPHGSIAGDLVANPSVAAVLRSSLDAIGAAIGARAA